MRWVLKAAAHRALSTLPQAERLNYTLQRYVTRSLPTPEATVRHKFKRAARHLAAYREHGPGRPLEAAVFYEFGAGWDFAIPLALWTLGVERQILIDVRPNVRLELVNETARRLGRMLLELETKTGRTLRAPDPAPLRTLHDLEHHFGIRYLAPRDAHATGLPSSSVDFASSAATLEHIPAIDLVPLLAECRRLLRPDGAMSSRIDLRDHYAHFDPTISPYNFLRFGMRTWRIFNPPLHHQNRLRRPDYLEAFATAGFDIVEERVTEPSERDLAALKAIRLAPAFQSYPLGELAVKAMRVIAKPAR